MKQKLLGAASLVAFILALASCQEQKQSELNLDSVTQQVIVSAKVTYDAGVKIDPKNPKSYILANAEPVTFKKVFIEIPYAEYSPTAAAGVRIFEAVTDSVGMFTISLPTKSTGVHATIRLEEFTAVHQEYDKMGDDGKPIFKVQLYTYYTPDELSGNNPAIPQNVLTLMPGAFSFPDNNDICYAGRPVDDEPYDESVTIAGNVKLAQETGFREGSFKNADNADVEFKILYPELLDINGAPMVLTFGTRTDANGDYTVTLPMKSLSDGFTINSIKVLGVGQNKFVHWIDATTKDTVPGAYKTAQNDIRNVALPFGEVVSGITYNLGTKYLPFVPYYNGDILANTPEPENWDADLIGWAAAKFDETFNKTVTLTGQIFVPVMTAYGQGAYTPSKQVFVIKGGVYNNIQNGVPKGFTGVTDDMGRFSITLPSDNPEVDPNIIIEPENKPQPFVFINSNGQPVTFHDGHYSNYKQVKINKDDEWYKLGNIYFKYDPAASEVTDEWNQNLFGWYIDPLFTESVAVTGKILFAYETAYGEGAYKYINHIVTVEDITDPAQPRRFAIMPTEGSFDFNLPVKDKNSTRVIRILFFDDDNNNLFKTNEFPHYAKYGTTQPRLLEGYYTRKIQVFEKPEDKDAWNNLGTTYMYIDENDLISDCDSYKDNLANWYIMTDNRVRLTEFETAIGEVKFAEETGYMEGKMNPAANKLIPVKIGNEKVNVLTNNQGKFQMKVYYKSDAAKPNLSIPASPESDITFEEFTHYENAEGKTIVIAGTYKSEQIRKKDAQWYDYGTIYYKFTPDILPDNWNYTKDISGWSYQQDFEITKTVTGYIKLAKETAFLKGNYQTEKDIPVKIYWDKNGNGALDYNEPIYIGKSDANGKFEINVPLEKETDEPKIELDELGFDYDNFVHYTDAQGKTKVLKGVYNGQKVQAEDAAWNDLGTIYYKFTPDDPIENWNYTRYTAGWAYKQGYEITKTVSGYVKLAKETGFLKGNYQADKDIPVKIQLGNDPDLIFAATTNAQGKFEIPVLIENENDEPNVNVLEMGFGLYDGFVYNEFTHYVDAQKTRILKGMYKGQHIAKAKADWNDAGTIYYKFFPDNSAEVEYWNDYTRYTAGWIYKEGFEITKNVTGYVKLAKETAYLKGDYQAEKDIPVKIQLNGDFSLTFVAPTDAQGKFDIPVLVEQQNDEPQVNVLELGVGVNDGFEYDEFLHYIDATGKTKNLKGTYKGLQKTTANAKWNEAGTIYYKFFPDNAAAIEDWNDYTRYTAGWVFKEDYDIDKTVEGYVKLAKETGYLFGNYQGVKNIKVKIKLYNDNDLIYVVPTDADGKFSVPVKLQDEDDEPAVTPMNLSFEFKEFEHYADASGTKIKKIDGTYNGEQVISQNHEWNDAGTIYYKFTPTTFPDNWNTYTRYIAGWAYKEGYDNTKLVSGYVKVAEETGYLTGNYKAGNGIPVKVFMDLNGNDYPDYGEPILVAPTNNQGYFAINVPIEDEDIKYDIDVWDLGVGIDVKDFNHFVNATGKQKALTGSYTGEQVKDPEAEWTDLGIIYFKFNPDYANKPAEWETFTKYIAGWIYKQGYDITKTVTGFAKVAKETGYLTGNYQAEKNLPIKIQLDGDPELIFVAVTNEQGKFVIDVPVEKDDSEPVVIALGLNTGFQYDEFLHYADVTGKTNTLTGKYTGEQIRKTDAEWNDAGILYYKFNPDYANKPAEWDGQTQYIAGWAFKDGFDFTKTVTGKVLLAKESGYLVGDYQAEKDIPVLIRLDLNGNDVTDYGEPVLISLTDNSGKFAITVPVEDENNDVDVDILSLYNLSYKNFTHYDAQGQTKILEGEYNGSQIKDNDAEWTDAGSIYYKFTPNNDANKPAEWDTYTKYTAGWVYKKGFDVKKAVSGNVKFAQETGFLLGDFGADPQNKPIRVYVNGDAANRTYAVPVAQDGSFTVNIDVEDINDEPGITVDVLNIDEENFIDYVNAEGKTKKITGHYEGDLIRPAGSAWAERGTIYYTFVPDNIGDNKPEIWDDYSQYIAGWFHLDGYNFAQTVTGNVKLAQETSFWRGDFEAEAKGIPVKFRLYNDDDHMYVGATDADGFFNIPVYIKNSYDNPSVDWKSLPITLAQLNNRKFIHYYQPGEIGTQPKLNISGQYEEGQTVKDPAKSWYQLGTRYYTFTKSGVVENWSSQIAGWQIWPAGYNKKLTVKAAVQKAVEEFKSNAANATEKWEYVPYAKVTVTVTVDAVDYTYKVTTEENGSFQIEAFDDDVPNDLTVVIVPDQIEEEFMHWTDINDRNSLTYLNHKYISANNVDGSTPIDKTGGSASNGIYDLTKSSPYSAKLIYNNWPDSDPIGWGDYTWDLDAR